MEVIVATVIATIAVVGLAYTFGMGKGFINRFQVARAALAAAEGRLEALASAPSSDPDVTPLIQHTGNFVVDGVTLGTENWIIQWEDDPADGLAPTDTNPHDLRRATVTVLFQQASAQDSLQLTRLIPPQ